MLSEYFLEKQPILGQDPREVVMSMTPRGADAVIDAVGSLFGQAIDLVRRGGKNLLFGVNTQAETTIRQLSITINQFDVIGSFISMGQGINLRLQAELSLADNSP